MPTRLLFGAVSSGKGDAGKWLLKFNAAYEKKLRMPVFPGSLNIVVANALDWFSAETQAQVVWFKKEEYGGERDILLLPCKILSCDERPGYLWATTNEARAFRVPPQVELICSVGLRASYGLLDGDAISLSLPY